MIVNNTRLQKYQHILDLDLRCYIRSAYRRIAKDKKRERAYLTIIPKPCSQKRDYKNHYFGDVSGFTLLNAEEEYGLFDRYNYLKYRIRQLQKEFLHTGKTQTLKQAEQYYNNYIKVRHILAESNLRLVVKVANSKTYDDQSRLQDIISDYNLVLLRCIDRFDYRRGFKFSTYITSALINESRRRQKKTIYTESSDYLDELAIYEPDYVSDIEKCDLGVVKTLLSNLEERDYDIICKRFGLNGHQKMTLRGIAEIYNITKERVRQIEMRILHQMRFDCGDKTEI